MMSLLNRNDKQMVNVTPFFSLISRVSQRQRTRVGFLIAGLLFYGVFWLGYRQIDENLYINRDDAIITVSHARNFVEYGSIGVNPSGERVEGYSSPLQFWTFSGAYALTRLHYDLYFRIVAGLSAFVMGLLLFALCLPHRKLGLALVPLAAFALTRDLSFFEWHASGMENALTHMFFLLAVVLLLRMTTEHKLNYWYALPLFAASIARIESIYHIGPLLAIFVVFWLITHRQPKRLESPCPQGGPAPSFPRTWESRTRWGALIRTKLDPRVRGDDALLSRSGRECLRGFAFPGLVLALWAVFFGVRWYYFGAVFPNTAAAQAISIGDRVAMFLDGNTAYLEQSWGLTKNLFFWHHGMLLLPIFVCLPLLKFTRKTVLAILLLLSLCFTGLFSPFLFGAARLDTTRLSTQVALAIVVLAAVVIVHTRRPRYRLFTVPLMLVCVSGLLYWSHAKWEHKPYYLWFSEDVFAKFRNELVELREKHDIPRPTLANPDLGLMSWHKDFNIVDMGYLGNPVLTKLDAVHDDAKRDIANYFFDIAAPDLIELHGIWSERHAHLFKDPRFRENYAAARTTIDGLLRKRFTRSATFRAEYGEYVRAGYWVRRDIMADSDSRERKLVDDLRRALSLERLEGELKRCEEAGLAPAQTFYVVRSAYRFIPELVEHGLYGDVVALLDRYQPKLGYSTALLRGRSKRGWHDELVSFVEAYSPERIRDRMEREFEESFFSHVSVHPEEHPTPSFPQMWESRTRQKPPATELDPRVRGDDGLLLDSGGEHLPSRSDDKEDPNREIIAGLNLLDCRLTPTEKGWGKLQLLFDCDRPIEKDWKIYVHATVPEEKRDRLPKRLQKLGFINWDFGFPDPPTSQWHTYQRIVLTQYVPYGTDVESIRVGLYRPGEGALGKPAVLSIAKFD
ncbi:MAG: hypothetical protein L3K26_01875 [Candidatus Hydrogenedentes bacterium]|nr:hypothetical protein [Candidatus Hydrogenedentota bacterium]